MATLRDVMMAGNDDPAGDDEAGDAQAAREAAAIRLGRNFGRYQAPQTTPGVPPDWGAAAAAADPFGVPSWAVGKVSPEARDAWRETYEQNPSDPIFGALAPVPFAGKGFELAGEGVRAAAKPVMAAVKSFPRTMGNVLGIGAVGTAATEAAESSKEMKARADEYDSQVSQIQQRITDGEAELKNLGNKKSPEPGSFKSARAQRAAETRAGAASDRLTNQMKTVSDQLEKDRGRLSEVQGIQDTIKTAAREKEVQEQPLVERSPWTGKLAGVGGVLAAAAAYNPRLRAVMMNRQFASDLNTMMPEIEGAAGRTIMTGKGLPAAKPFQPTGGDITAIEQARAMGKRADTMRTAGEGSLAEGLKAAPAGMFAAAEGAMMPYQIDWATAQPGTPAYKAALDRFGTAEGWGKTGVASLIGGTGSMVGAKLPTYRAPAATLESDLARAEGAVNAFDMRKAAAAAPPTVPLANPRLAAGPIPGVAPLTPAVVAARRATAPANTPAITPMAPPIPSGPMPATVPMRGGVPQGATLADIKATLESGQPTRAAAAAAAPPALPGRVTEADLAASNARMQAARDRMDTAFKKAGTAEITPRRAEIIRDLNRGGHSAADLRRLYNEYWAPMP